MALEVVGALGRVRNLHYEQAAVLALLDPDLEPLSVVLSHLGPQNQTLGLCVFAGYVRVLGTAQHSHKNILQVFCLDHAGLVVGQV